MGGGGAPANQAPGAPSWATGSLNQNSITPEAFNQGMLGDIANTYLKGPTQQSFVGLGADSQNALSSLDIAARTNAGLLDTARDTTRNLMTSGGLTDAQRGYGQEMGNIGAGYGAIGAQAQQPSLTESTLMGRATGAEMANNPYLENMIGQSRDRTYADVMGSFGGSGGVGSNIQTDQLAKSLFNAESGLRYNDYNNAMSRQMEALGAIEGQRQTGVGNQFGALAGQAGAAQTGFGMEQQGLSNATTAAGNAGSIFRDMTLPAQQQLMVGGVRDANDLARAQFDPAFTHLARYQSLGNQQASGAQPERQPGLFDWLGLGIGAAGLFL